MFPRGSVIPTDACRRGDVGLARAKKMILNGFWKIPLTRPDFRLSDSYYSVFVIFISLAQRIHSRQENKRPLGLFHAGVVRHIANVAVLHEA